MLEVLLMQYKDQFGMDFPLRDFAGWTEIDLINLIYDCLVNNDPSVKDRKVVNRIEGIK